MQPNDPDENPTQPLDQPWTPGPHGPDRSDTVDSASPPAPTVAGGGRRGVRALVIAAAVLALVAAGAFGALLAGGTGDDQPTALVGAASSTDGDDSDEDSADDGAQGDRARGHGRGPFGHGMGGPGLLGGPVGRGLHGSFVVTGPDGGYQTVLTQRGTATAVSDTSITVESEDGFEATYRLTDDSVVMSGPSGTDAIAEGADVAVTAVKTGSTARVVHVADLSQLADRFEHHFGPGHGRAGDDGDDETPQPSGTATSGASV